MFQRFSLAGSSVCHSVIVLAMAVGSTGLLAGGGLAQEPSALQTAVAMQKLLVESIAKAEKSVVAIARVRKDRSRPGFRATVTDPTSPDFVPNEFGTGVVIDRRGLILTAYHVIGDPEKNDYFVWISRKPFKVERVSKVKAADPWMDLAVLEVEADDLVPIEFGDAEKLKKGQFVIALGNPYGIARDGDVSATWGIVSNLGRQAPVRPGRNPSSANRETLHNYGTLIQTDARLPMGTSGGALLNLEGKMIGMTTSLTARPGFADAAGFAIPVNEAFRSTVKTLKEGRVADYGFLGIMPVVLPLHKRRAGEIGVRVYSVVHGTPAHAADLMVNDIVTHVDGKPIYEPKDLIRDVSQMPVEATVELSLKRPFGGKWRELKRNVHLAKKYVATARPVIADRPNRIWRGMQVDYSTAIPPIQFQQRPGDVLLTKSVAVTSVETDTPAWRADIRPWVFVTHVEGQSVTTPREFFAAVDAQGSKPVRIRLGGGETIVAPN